MGSLLIPEIFGPVASTITKAWKNVLIRFVGVAIKFSTTVEKMGVSCILVLLDGIVV